MKKLKKIFMTIGHIFVYACFAFFGVTLLIALISIGGEFKAHENTEFASYDDFSGTGLLFSEKLPDSAADIQYYSYHRGFLRVTKKAVKYTVSGEDFETLKAEKINRYNDFYNPDDPDMLYSSFPDTGGELSGGLYDSNLKFLDNILDAGKKYRFLTYLKYGFNYIEYDGVILNEDEKQVIEYYYYKYTN